MAGAKRLQDALAGLGVEFALPEVWYFFSLLQQASYQELRRL
jgi:hypothetical protein